MAGEKVKVSQMAEEMVEESQMEDEVNFRWRRKR
jgi:hypothetical protein